MIKVSTFLRQNELGYTAIPIFGSRASDRELEKTAGAQLMAPVSQYIRSLRPRNDAQYVLVNALGASEYFGSNINGDAFPEAGLIHAPAGWTGNPLVDKALADGWAYGYPTFYNAHPFAHHRNKDPSRAYGEVELAVWNDLMKRVELVVRVDYDKCLQFGGIPVWDKLKAGQFPDVSMGSKVPFDTSSITLDWSAYNDAKATFDPKKHKSPGQAILEYHKKHPIKGLSITRDDYDEYCLKYMNRIFPDGRKVFVYNDYPKFFDISFVFIGADRTAKVMVYVVRNGAVQSEPSVKVAAALGYDQDDVILEKSASAKSAESKSAEIDKEVLPIPEAIKAIPLMTRNEPDLPRDVIGALAASPLASALSTLSGMGMILRPREFQRMMLLREGQGPLADHLEERNVLFPRVEESECPCSLSPDAFLPALARLLMPSFEHRTALAPSIERRVVIIGVDDGDEPSSHPSELLRKIGAAYNGYRGQLLEMAPYTQMLIEKVATRRDHDLLKLAASNPEEVFTPLSYCYLHSAYMNELPFAYSTREVVQLSH